MSASRSPYPVGPTLPSTSERSAQPGNAVVPKVLNLAEAAAFVRCSRAHLSNVANGKIRGVPRLPTVRIGRRLLFRRESLNVWLEELEASSRGRSAK